jgi:N-acetylmuramic acid 6-phosphate etherase
VNQACQHSEEFLRIADQFRLGALTTEASHPVTAQLSEVAQRDTAAALRLLFEVDDDVVRAYREFVQSGRAESLAAAVRERLERGGRMFFTGCGSTGRLSIQLVAIWRDFWQQQAAAGCPSAGDWEQRALSVMAGGDFALIKSVEGFEDFAAFGRKQLADLGVTADDVVFAITEGGETSFVIGTAWQGVAAGAKVFFVFNNPDATLNQHVERSREVLAEARIEKLNLTTGPMAISGSTRMQATSIQLCVLLTVLEMVLRDVIQRLKPGNHGGPASAPVPAEFLRQLEAMLGTLKSPTLLTALASLVELEAGVYRAGRRNSYFADRFGLDVLTDTTERSPTYCTPSFRKHGDTTAAESWAFLFLPETDTPRAWKRLLKRPPRCVEWTETEVRALVSEEQFPRTLEIIRRISAQELLRFHVGQDGLAGRPLGSGDGAVGVLSGRELASLLTPAGFVRTQLTAAHTAGARIGLILLGEETALAPAREFLAQWNPECVAVFVPVPRTDFLLDGVTRAGLKLLLNALSTATMVRLGRVMGNTMIWVVASNLKLMDRATRYIQRLAGLDYPTANVRLFEALEYVGPRLRAEQTYPPVVGLAVLRACYGISHEEAEQRLASGGSVRSSTTC